jgi:hypothetical protein
MGDSSQYAMSHLGQKPPPRFVTGGDGCSPLRKRIMPKELASLGNMKPALAISLYDLIDHWLRSRSGRSLPRSQRSPIARVLRRPPDGLAACADNVEFVRVPGRQKTCAYDALLHGDVDLILSIHGPSVLGRWCSVWTGGPIGRAICLPRRMEIWAPRDNF